MNRGKHDDLCFGEESDAIAEALIAPVRSLFSTIFPKGFKKQYSTNLGGANVNIVANGECEFIIPGQAGMYFNPSSLEVEYEVTYCSPDRTPTF